MKLQHKYSAVNVERDGFKFSSEEEELRYDELKFLVMTGDIIMFLHQVPFRMPGSTYWADFMVFWWDDEITIEEVTGVKTAAYKKQKEMMAVHFPAVEIYEPYRDW